MSDRARVVAEKRMAGMTTYEVARDFDVHEDRIRQILRKDPTAYAIATLQDRIRLNSTGKKATKILLNAINEIKRLSAEVTHLSDPSGSQTRYKQPSHDSRDEYITCSIDPDPVDSIQERH